MKCSTMQGFYAQLTGGSRSSGGYSGIQGIYAQLTGEDLYIYIYIYIYICIYIYVCVCVWVCHRHGKGIKKRQQGLALS